MRCQQCGVDLVPDTRFCPGCGAPAPPPEQRICARCGAELQPGWQYCVACGVTLVGSEGAGHGGGATTEPSGIPGSQQPSAGPTREPPPATRGPAPAQPKPRSGAPGCCLWAVVAAVVLTVGSLVVVASRLGDKGPSLVPGVDAPRPTAAAAVATTAPAGPRTPLPEPPADVRLPTPVPPANLVGLSADQQEVVSDFGWPHSFLVIEVDDDAQRARRHEWWSYHDAALSYVFVDGDFLRSDPTRQVSNVQSRTAYRPNQVTFGLKPEEAKARLAAGTWSKLDGTDRLLAGVVDGVEIWGNEQLVAGFVKGRLVLLQAAAPGAGGGQR